MAVTTWDGANKGADVTLSGGNLAADATGGQHWVYATVGRASSEGLVRVWEMTVVSTGGNLRPTFGLAKAGANVSAFMGLDPLAIAFDSGVQFLTSNTYWVGGSSVGTWYGTSEGIGGTIFSIGFEWNESAGTLKIYYNGVLKFTLSSVTGTWFPAYGTGQGGGLNDHHDKITANFSTAPSTFTPSVSAQPWDYEIPSPPVANFTRTPVSGSLPLSVAFTDTSTNVPTSWLWDFGDGSTSTSQSPTHVYAIPGQYTVKLTATNAGGTNTKTLTSAVLAGAITTQRPDARLVGATYLALAPSLLAISCIDTRQVVIANRSNASISGTTGDLGSNPGAIMYFQSALWVMTAAGNVLSLAAAATPTVLTTTAVAAATAHWITGTGSIVIAPQATGGIVTLDTSGNILYRMDGVLSRVRWAIASGGYLYAFDGRGTAAIVQVSTTGALTFISRFSAPGTQSILSGYVSGNALILACSGHSAVITLDITAPTAPVVGAPVSVYPKTLNAVLNNSAVTPLTNEEQSSLGLAYWFPVNAGSYQTGPATYLLHARSGRLSLVTD